jgi:hypothetical protein
VTVDFGAAGRQDVSLSVGDRKKLTVPPGASTVVVTARGAGVLARLERHFIRPFDVAPSVSDAPVRLSLEWPTDVHVARIGTLVVRVSDPANRNRGSSGTDVKIPLPPGATLADTVANVSQIQGVLHVWVPSGANRELEVPLRFGLAGSFTAPEGTARLRDQQASVAYDRARPIVVLP